LLTFVRSPNKERQRIFGPFIEYDSELQLKLLALVFQVSSTIPLVLRPLLHCADRLSHAVLRHVIQLIPRQCGSEADERSAFLSHAMGFLLPLLAVVQHREWSELVELLDEIAMTTVQLEVDVEQTQKSLIELATVNVSNRKKQVEFFFFFYFPPFTEWLVVRCVVSISSTIRMAVDAFVGRV
jgi:hypothetical protein